VFARVQSGNMEKMKNRLSARQKPGPSYNALKRKLVARYQHWLVAQHNGMGTKRGYMRSAIPGKESTHDRHPPRRATLHRAVSGKGATLSRAHEMQSAGCYITIGDRLSTLSPRDVEGDS
jgi:hypothetical protein